MRLLFTSSAFPRPGDDARAPYNLRLCEALAEHHEVTVVSPVPWTQWGAWARSPQKVGALRDVRYSLFLYPPAMLRDSHAWCMRHAIRRGIRAAGKAWKPDAVISYWTYPDGAAAADMARELGAPVVMMVGGSDVEVLARREEHRQRIAHTLARADAVVATSRSLRRSIEALGVNPDRIAIVRRGVDRQTFRPGSRDTARRDVGVPPGVRLLLWVGRLDAVKGPDLLLDALGLVAAAGATTAWHCYLVGDGALRRRMTRLAEERRLGGRVTLLGALPASALARWYQAADAVVISSRSEGLPNVLSEAKACGVPVIATNVGGVAELMNEDDRLVAPNDPDALARAIDDAIQRPESDSSPPPIGSLVLPSWRDSAAELTTIVARAIEDGSRIAAT